MTHPTYADTGEPVLIGDEALLVDQLGYPNLAYLNPIGTDHMLHAEIMGGTFYKHRHNAIAAWEKLLEVHNGN